MAKKPRKGGKRIGAGRKPGDKNKDPRALMKDMGVASHWLSPVEFCLAVQNNDLNMIYGPPEEGKQYDIIPLGQRIEAARIAAPYMHQKLPYLVDQNVTVSWADIIAEADEREKVMRKPASNESERSNPSIH